MNAKVPQHEKKYWSYNRLFYVSGVSGRWWVYAANGDRAISDPFANLNKAQIEMNALKVKS